MNLPHSDRRQRALSAARAMTLGGAVAVAAGCTPSTPPGETPPETVERIAQEAVQNAYGAIAGAECNLEASDDICPDDCTRRTDYDCCLQWGGEGWCEMDPTRGCICAVEGPFRPPQFA